MSTRDMCRVHFRRRAIHEGWPPGLLAVVEDLADTAREDGTHALRSVRDQADRLGISQSTIKRHRRELTALGALTVRKLGGNGRGATVVDLAGSRSGSQVGVGVTPDSQLSRGSQSGVLVTSDLGSMGSVGDQSGLTVDREREPGLLALSPSKQQNREDRPMEDTTWLAAELDADPAACRSAIDIKRRQADERGRPWRNASHMIRNVITLDEWRPLVEQHKPAARPVTHAQCGQPGCAGPHKWTDGRNNNYCQGP